MRNWLACVIALGVSLTAASAGTLVRFQTTIGNLDVELYDSDKPVTVSNFLAYVQNGLYTNMFLHRAVQDFVIQGGGYYVADLGTTNAQIAAVTNYPQIIGEAGVGTFYSNIYGTIAMALSTGPNSATSQFFFNLADNSSLLDGTNDGGPFTVFGHVIAGTNVLNLLNVGGANTTVQEVDLGSPFDQLPVLYSANPADITFNDLIYAGVFLWPAIQSQPTNLTVIEGQPASFSVTASGTSPLSYQWYRNGSPISNANTGTYLVQAAGAGDAATYSVGVSNVAGVVTSSNAVLNVLLWPAIQSQPTNLTVAEGQSASFSVTASGTSPLSYQWYRNGSPISGATSSTCHLFSVGSDGPYYPGNYTVVISNVAGVVTSSIAVLTEVVPPVTITSPAANARITNSIATTITVAGTLSDTSVIAGVSWQLNTNAWMPATTSDGWAHWSNTNVSPQIGTNVLRVFAFDPDGNPSATNSVSFVYFQNFSITLLTNGSGQITQTPKGTLFPAGAKVSFTAAPGKNWFFSNWGSNSVLTLPSLSLTLVTNLTLQANFVTNPFLAFSSVGTYQGLFQDPDTNQVRLENSGFVSVSVTSAGGYSCQLVLTNKSFSCSGHFDVSGFSSNSILVDKQPWATVWLQLDIAQRTLTGTLSNQDWTATLAAFRTGLSPQADVGAYTLLIPGSDDPSMQPGGEGFATLTLAASGLATIKGTLADNTALSRSAMVSQDGSWPLYAPLYSGQGALFGWLFFTNDQDSDLSGNLTWIKLGQKAAYYPEGFTNQPLAIGSRYTPAVPAPGFTNGFLALTDTRLTNQFTIPSMIPFSIGANNKVSSPNSSLKLTFTTASGLFQGTVSNPFVGGMPKTLSIKGALLTKQTNGAGFFLTTNQSGSVFLAPAP